jgi:hypothetical protein
MSRPYCIREGLGMGKKKLQFPSCSAGVPVEGELGVGLHFFNPLTPFLRGINFSRRIGTIYRNGG